MNKAIPEKQLRQDLDRIVREVTEAEAGILLTRGEVPPKEHICTVHIDFRKGFHSSLTFRADSTLFVRMAQAMLRVESVSSQDLEDVAKEYFNVLCGRIAAALYEATHIAPRFNVPSFYQGIFSPADHAEQFAIRYTSGQNEAVELVHHVPILRDEDGGT